MMDAVLSFILFTHSFISKLQLMKELYFSQQEAILYRHKKKNFSLFVNTIMKINLIKLKH